MAGKGRRTASMELLDYLPFPPRDAALNAAGLIPEAGDWILAPCSRSGSRVALRVLFLHVPAGQVGIHLGCGDAGVAQQFLHVP